MTELGLVDRIVGLEGGWNVVQVEDVVVDDMRSVIVGVFTGAGEDAITSMKDETGMM